MIDQHFITSSHIVNLDMLIILSCKIEFVRICQYSGVVILDGGSIKID